MAAITTVTLTCDMPHGGQTPAKATRTIVIGNDTREIDLCLPHDLELARKTAPFMEAGRAVTVRRRSNPGQPTTGPGRKAVRDENRAKRQFLRASGREVSDLGKFSKIDEAFLAANYRPAGCESASPPA